MSQNLENPNFFKGKYSTKGKFKPTTVSGLPALVLEAGDYEQIKTQLTKSLTTKSNFQHGVGVRITKLSNDKADGDYSCVQLKVKCARFCRWLCLYTFYNIWVFTVEPNANAPRRRSDCVSRARCIYDQAFGTQRCCFRNQAGQHKEWV